MKRPCNFPLKIHFNRNHSTHDHHLSFKFIGFAIHINNIFAKTNNSSNDGNNAFCLFEIQHYFCLTFSVQYHNKMGKETKNKTNVLLDTHSTRTKQKYDGINNDDDDAKNEKYAETRRRTYKMEIQRTYIYAKGKGKMKIK